MKRYIVNCDLGVSYDIHVSAKNAREATAKARRRLKKKAIILRDWRFGADENILW